MEHVIEFSADGRVRSMHNDKFPLGFLGEQKIERASDIRFDAETQLWGIWFVVRGEFTAPSPEYAGFKEYDGARRFEVRTMNECMKAGLEPDAPEVRSWARSRRRK